jgi:hypothetical protein
VGQTTRARDPRESETAPGSIPNGGGGGFSISHGATNFEHNQLKDSEPFPPAGPTYRATSPSFGTNLFEYENPLFIGHDNVRKLVTVDVVDNELGADAGIIVNLVR